MRSKKTTKNLIILEAKKPSAEETIEGVIQGNERGYAFLLNEQGDYFVTHQDLRGALNGDIVIAKEIRSIGHSRQAEVLKIISRGADKIVGSFQSGKTGGFVIADERKFSSDIFIPLKKCGAAKTGDKVECKICAYPKKKNPEGEIIEILGKIGDKNTEIKCIAKTYKLAEKFSNRVINNAKQVAKEPTKIDIAKRADFRNLQTITIDGEDAKDFDDAISISKEGENYILGVHIADVSNYVTADSELDIEAFARATSVYFPESVIPMLPEELSNNVCSLMEGKDRLTLSCLMTIDNKGTVISSKIAEGVIRSTARMTYTNVAKILDGDKDLSKKYAKILPMITLMNELALILIEKRKIRGSIDLDITEAKITVDKFDNIEITKFDRTIANQMIEEFMILANETVAETYFPRKVPFIYRVHEKPSDEKLENFSVFLKELSLSPMWDKESVCSKDFSDILDKASDTPYFPIINKIMLRTMQKAKYSPDDIGHFGLSSTHYCHFTSPIRRYPDLAIHRIIKTSLHGESDMSLNKYKDFVASASKQASTKERNSQEAERAADDYYKMTYMSKHIGEEYEGIVSGVTNFGIFVELPNTVEGLIRVETLSGGRYEYNETNLSLTSKENSYKFGQAVSIVVTGVDTANRRVEFLIKGTKLSKNRY